MKKVTLLSLALILLIGIMSHGTSSYFSDTETSAGNTFTAWVEEIVCAKFNVSDDVDLKVYQYNYPPRTFTGSFNLSGGNDKPSGVATVGNYVYVLDQEDKQVYKYTCSGTLEDVSRALRKQGGSSLGNPYGLAIYGGDMWVVVWGQDFIMYHYPLSAAFTGSGNINADLQIICHTDNTKPTGLAVDENYIYVVDSTDKQIYRYQDTGSPVTVSKVLKEAGGGNLGNPTGLMLDSTSLWVVDKDNDKVYEYDKESSFPDDGSSEYAIDEFELDSNNSDPSGV